MANFTLDDLEERIKKLEELQEIQESNDNSINQVDLLLEIKINIILELDCHVTSFDKNIRALEKVLRNA